MICAANSRAQIQLSKYPSNWFAPINDSNKPAWEILPQEAKAGGGYFVEAE